MARDMKDSGIAWIGRIPSTWTTKRIGGLYSVRNEKVSDKVFMPLSVTMKGVVPQLETAAKTNDGDNRKLVRKGDFAINSRSDRRGSCGISSYDGSVSLINTVLTPRTEMNLQYYDWLFHTIQFADEFYKWGHGIVDDLWTTGWQEMKRIFIPVPTHEEQEKIASFLNSKCFELDSLSSDIQKEIETLEAYRNSMISTAVSKGISKKEIRPSGKSFIDSIPVNWQIKRFKYVARVCSNLVQPDAFLDFPQISPENIEKNTGKLLHYQTVEESGIISGNHLFKTGQILFSKIRPELNKATIAPFVGLCSADMYPIEAYCNTKFLLYAMLSKYFLQQVTLVTKDRVKMPKINQEELGEIFVILPPIEEQILIARYLDEKCPEIDSIISSKRQQLETLAAYKKSLIYEYVTGKKEVR